MSRASLLFSIGLLGLLAIACSVDAPVALTDSGGDRPDAASPDAASPGERGDAMAVEPATCPPPPACEAPLPAFGDTAPWRHSSTRFTTGQGAARHRGRDLHLREGDPQWALAKFAYGGADDDLEDEDVDVWLLRGCADTWELLGTATTTEVDGQHETVERIVDDEGRVYFPIPADRRLGLGRHRILFVVRGDHSMASQYIEVLPPDARFVVSDVDGTQTESETAEWQAIFGGADPAAQPYGADLLWAFARRGYHIYYVTARPDWLDARTHEWLSVHGYPPGNVHTTLGGTGANGSAAVAFKTEELAELEERFPGALEVTIGNTDTDAEAFQNAGVPPDHSFLYQYDPGTIGTRVDDYAALLPFAGEEPSVCR